MDAPDHRHQVRNKGKSDRLSRDLGEVLRDFGEMPVSGDRVGLETFATLPHQCPHHGFAASPAHPRLGVGDQRIRVQQSRLDQRQETQSHRRGVTTGIGHDPGLPNRLPIEFRETVDRLCQQLGTSVRRAVPLRPDFRIGEPKIGRQVDHPGAGRHQVRHHLHGGTVRGGEKHHIARRQGVTIGFGKSEFERSPQIGEEIRYRPARFGAGGDHGDLHRRMRRQQTQQLHPGITGPTNDANLNHGTTPERKKRLESRLSLQ